MNSLRTFLVFTAIATTATLTSSCTATPIQWTRPGASQTTMEADRARCQYETDRATAAIEDPVHAGFQDSALNQSCMRAKGWKRS